MSHAIPATLTAALTAAQSAQRGPLGPRFEVKKESRQAAILLLFGAVDDAHTGDAGLLTVDDLDIVLEVRADTLRAHPGEVAFPGGGRDREDTTIEATALREAEEEIGLDPADALVLGSLAETGTVSAFRVTPVVAWRSRGVTFVPVDTAETAEVHRVPLADLLNPAHRFTSVYRHDLGDFRGPAFDLHGVIVWGFTAFVLDEFFTAAGWTIPWDQAVERDI